MTLAKLQLYTKVSAAIFVLVLYGVVSYSVGKISAGDNDAQVKGASTKVKEDPVERPQPYTDVQSTKIIGSSVKLCSNTTAGFGVSYPNDWFTTYNSPNEQCTFFAPYTFVVPQSADDNLTPIKITPIDASKWEDTVKFYENPNEFRNVKTSQNIDVNSHLAKRVEAESTGTGSVPRGFILIDYLVFDAKVPLVVSYVQKQDKDDIGQIDTVLKEMVESLKFL